jgi:hypothetical protein
MISKQRQGESSRHLCAKLLRMRAAKTEAAPRRINVMRLTIREYQSDSPSSASRSSAVRCPQLSLARFPGHTLSAGEEPANEVSWENNVGPSVKSSSVML